jgi:hypothetical protein
MWEILGDARVAILGIAAFACMSVNAQAQNTFINQNISGFNLPGVQLPQGHDEVRAADGTTCRSAVSGSGAYVDVGVIGNPEQDTHGDGSFAAYGRLVIPLGVKAPRLDCSQLYDLEVQRLSMELKLMQMGLNRGIAPVTENDGSEGDDWGSPEQLADADSKSAIKTSGSGKSGTKSQNPVKLTHARPSRNWIDEGWTTEGRTQ